MLLLFSHCHLVHFSLCFLILSLSTMCIVEIRNLLTLDWEVTASSAVYTMISGKYSDGLFFTWDTDGILSILNCKTCFDTQKN